MDVCRPSIQLLNVLLVDADGILVVEGEAVDVAAYGERWERSVLDRRRVLQKTGPYSGTRRH